MGRPPKKRAREDENLSHLGLSGSEVWADSDSSQFTSLGVDIPVVPESLPFCAPVYSSPFSTPQAYPHLVSTSNIDHNHSWQLDHGKFLDPVPATTGPWPDFSSVSAAASNSFSLPPGLPQLQSPPTSPSDPDSSEAQCTCLSYLYLCLSHLSSLAPFPVSQHTLCSLFIAAKTARAVIRCQACPKKFATGLQNVMFTGTLLTVMGDAWLRVSKADAAELGKQAAPSSYVYTINQNSSNPAESWKEWLRQTVRSGVAGVPSDPAGAVQCSGAPSLLSLIEEMEARQRRWHQSHPLPQSERLNVSPEVLAKPYDPQKEQDLLCLRVVKSAREVIAKFEFEPHEFPDGVGI
ncbi:Zn(II)2Cys6 transcription factor rglT [Aspergillus tanneri]|uniref:C6 finger domain protein n=1 Tax=Aspergillus tanneri TaxID=1220188 RepID=A0A5M9N4Q3_9EURO|nr:uncharacterized protein ATNIH1004_001117 [Aspergillus tanneri]KAA8652213.1 hypothetical protein ATNIH1004_001117 [Aspergillus tanneri]